MDFEIPSELKQVLLDRVNHGIFGYTESDDAYFNVLKQWFANRFNWNIDKKWLVKTPCVVFALAMAAVSYTHLDVYKRQSSMNTKSTKQRYGELVLFF